jgi:hypothetical protein
MLRSRLLKLRRTPQEPTHWATRADNIDIGQSSS